MLPGVKATLLTFLSPRKIANTVQGLLIRPVSGNLRLRYPSGLLISSTTSFVLNRTRTQDSDR